MIAAAAGRGLSVLTVGRNGTGIRLVDAAIDGFSQTLRIEHNGGAYRVRLPLVGAFQIENALVAAGMAIATGSDPVAVNDGHELLRLHLTATTTGDVP